GRHRHLGETKDLRRTVAVGEYRAHGFSFGRRAAVIGVTERAVWGGRLAGAAGPLEDVSDRYAERVGDAEGDLERWRVAALLDGDDGLPRDAGLLGKRRLGHLAGMKAQRPDGIADLGLALAHDPSPPGSR